MGREVKKGRGAIGRMGNFWKIKRIYGKLLKVLIYWIYIKIPPFPRMSLLKL